MKTKLFILLLIVFGTINKINANTTSDEKDQNNEKVLIAYFSKTGSTKQVAEYIQSFVGGDIVAIETKQKYPREYQAATEFAKQEKESNARPVLNTKVNNIADYDVIYVGFPIWWSYTPMAIATFLEGYDLSNKTVIPFCTHGGGGVGEAFAYVEKLSPRSSHLEGFVTNGARASRTELDVKHWLENIGVIK